MFTTMEDIGYPVLQGFRQSQAINLINIYLTVQTNTQYTKGLQR